MEMKRFTALGKYRAPDLSRVLRSVGPKSFLELVFEGHAGHLLKSQKNLTSDINQGLITYYHFMSVY
jgi:hypothetical protein